MSIDFSMYSIVNGALIFYNNKGDHLTIINKDMLLFKDHYGSKYIQ